jgi:5'-phosphate synthase pdxT subunit
MPGGESTTIQLVASHTPGLLEGLKDFVQDPTKAVWGTCAGMILMSDQDRGIGGGKIKKVDGGSLGGWGGIKGLRVWRNLYGGKSISVQAPCHILPLLHISLDMDVTYYTSSAFDRYLEDLLTP